MDYTFDDFLKTVEPQHKGFAENTHKELIANGYKAIIESKATGFFIGYKHPKTKRSLLNFLFRKKGLLVRIYPASRTPIISNEITEEMIQEIDKNPNCKKCSEKCPKGYKFTIGGQAYDKCWYGAFLFTITEKSKPIIEKWVKTEIKENK